ncbi:MAG: hypothetical protein AAF570_10095, partial [Bacteroidota bacterium]
MDIRKASPELIVRETPSGFVLTASIWPEGNEDFALIRETETRYKIVEFSQAHRDLFEVMGGEHFQVPEEGKAELLEALKGIATIVNINSEIEEVGHEMQQVEGDSQLYGHLLPFGDGYRLDLFVKPLGPEGPSLIPGNGAANVISKIGEEVLQAPRALQVERRAAEHIIAHCPVLTSVYTEDYKWKISRRESCLELLLQLKPLRDQGAVELVWPKGERLKLVREVSFADLSVQITDDNDWFGLGGSLRLDDEHEILLHELLTKMRDGQQQFVELDDGQFVALTAQLRRSLEEVAAFAAIEEDGVRLHVLAGLSLETFTSQAGQFNAGPNWHAQLRR